MGNFAASPLVDGRRYWSNDVPPSTKKTEESSFITHLFSVAIKPYNVLCELSSNAMKWNSNTNAAFIAPKVAVLSSSLYNIITIIFQVISKGSAANERSYPTGASKIEELAGAGLKYIKVAYLGMIAWSVMGIYQEVLRLRDHTLDASLRIAKHVSDIGFSASTTIAGLHSFGLVAATALKIIPFVNIAASVLSISEFCRHFKNAIKHKKNLTYLKNCSDNIADIKLMLKEIRNNRTENYFESKYGVNGKEMRRALRRICREAKQKMNKSNPLEVRLQGKKWLKATLDQLRLRSERNVYESKMSMIAALVDTVAILVISFSPIAPLAAVGFSMLVLSAGLHIVTLIYDRYSHRHFRRSLGLD